MSLSINKVNSYNNPFVSGNEATQVSNKIYSAASNATSASVKVSSKESYNTEVDALKQIAATKANLNVNMTAQTQDVMQALRAQAAQSMISKIVEGKVYVPAEASLTPQMIESTTPKAVHQEVFNVADMNGEKKGSNPFFVFTKAKKEQKEAEAAESLSLIA
jgi:hypothetical protein